jgi:mono/diheme cytochrome c family protein
LTFFPNLVLDYILRNLAITFWVVGDVGATSFSSTKHFSLRGDAMKKMLALALTVAVLGLTVPAAFAADLSADANFKAKCAMCHGANAEGKPAMKTAPLKDSASKSADELTATITNGKGKMPAYKGKLSDDEIKTLVTEIKALK